MTRQDLADCLPSQRLIHLLLILLRQPYRYTRKELAALFDVDKQTIRRMLRNLEQCGLKIEHDTSHSYAVLPKGYATELARLQALSKEELTRLTKGVTSEFTKAGEASAILNKLASLQNFQQLGLRALRSPELAKIDALETAIAGELCVRLDDYKSTNSNSVSPRLVEPFKVDTANGILHAYDLGRKAVRHFRLDRFVRVTAMEEAAQHTELHLVVPTDPFRIASSDQVRVHLNMNVAARNDLTERFPAALAYLVDAAEEERFDFDAQVNSALYGVLPFCMANWRGVQVLEPAALREKMREAAETILADST